MPQTYPDIASTDTLQNSLTPLKQRADAAKSLFSGTSFPSTGLLVGMPCFRTDQLKLYQLIDMTPTWRLIMDFNKTALQKEDADALYSLLTHNHNSTYQAINALLTAISGLSTAGLIERVDGSSAAIVAISAFTKTLLDDANAAAWRTTLGLGAVATDSIVPLERGGTGATSAAAARLALGVGTNGNGSRTVSTSSPTGGADGDIWYQV